MGKTVAMSTSAFALLCGSAAQDAYGWSSSEKEPQFLSRLQDAIPEIRDVEGYDAIADTLQQLISDDTSLPTFTPETVAILPLSVVEWCFECCWETESNKGVIRALFSRLLATDPQIVRKIFAQSEYFAWTPLKYELAAQHPELIDDKAIANSAICEHSDILTFEMFDVFGPERKANILWECMKLHFFDDVGIASESSAMLIRAMTLEQCQQLLDDDVEPEMFYTTFDNAVTDYVLGRFGLSMTDRVVMTASKLKWLFEHKDEEPHKSAFETFFESGYMKSLLVENWRLAKEDYVALVRAMIDCGGFTGEELPYESAKERAIHAMINYTVRTPPQNPGTEEERLRVLNDEKKRERRMVSKFEKVLRKQYGINGIEELASLL